jgi:hypothetical protein
MRFYKLSVGISASRAGVTVNQLVLGSVTAVVGYIMCGFRGRSVDM